ncbi:hypothetical protein A2397_03435 [Candidatus Amesbacteria bacterium RIFOXYB1_FULL_44_23]|uniref:N-acetylmuramoyl-L-alanine amidase n=1 Tax=Candidatus Amesbacteria bacterium RIFOXYB1_FULL_44_23 TaxID=1797263 RepID=A0A1F4ZU49_9BACT|nr:MAG: hypothetical protein A2397_03435 [Candidatus Amesbacteria bacterium RIFOXYB1_FULL_44_23]
MTVEKLAELLNTQPRAPEESKVLSELRTHWMEALSRPLWYKQLQTEIVSLLFAKNNGDSRQRWIRRQLIATIGCALKAGIIPLSPADEFADFDSEREPISDIVIHHTEGRPQTTPDELNALGFIFQYTKNFLAGPILGKSVENKPVGSGHVINGRQVFYAYHYLVNCDGEVVRLLHDTHIGWHAGNWNVNKRSVGIALAGNFDDCPPPQSQLDAVIDLIRNQYPNIEPQRVYGHYQVNFSKTCPGITYANLWKKTLLERLEQ